MRVYNDIGHHCPDALLNAGKASMYRPMASKLRVSEMNDSPLIRFLKMKHWDELSVPISRLIASIRGTAWHAYLEQFAPPEDMTEYRFNRHYPDHNITLTGQPDGYREDLRMLYD